MSNQSRFLPPTVEETNEQVAAARSVGLLTAEFVNPLRLSAYELAILELLLKVSDTAKLPSIRAAFLVAVAIESQRKPHPQKMKITAPPNKKNTMLIASFSVDPPEASIDGKIRTEVVSGPVKLVISNDGLTVKIIPIADAKPGAFKVVATADIDLSDEVNESIVEIEGETTELTADNIAGILSDPLPIDESVPADAKK